MHVAEGSPDDQLIVPDLDTCEFCFAEHQELRQLTLGVDLPNKKGAIKKSDVT